MDKLVEALFGRIEFMVLGAFALGSLAYLLAIYNPIRQLLLGYLLALDKFWLGRFADGPQDHEVPSEEAKPSVNSRHPVYFAMQIGVLVGVLYYLGVIANSSSYWLIEPVRFAILDRIYYSEIGGSCRQHCPGAKASDLPLMDALVLPIKRFNNSDMRIGESNRLYLRDEALADSGRDLHIDSVLGHELNFIRLQRGTVLISLGIMTIALLKLAVLLIFSPIWILSENQYRNFIDERGEWIAHERAEYPELDVQMLRMRVAIERLVIPQLLICAMATGLYVASMGSYRATEFEYSSLVRNSAQVQLKNWSANSPATLESHATSEAQ